jgi:hypothetical protein
MADDPYAWEKIERQRAEDARYEEDAPTPDEYAPGPPHADPPKLVPSRATTGAIGSRDWPGLLKLAEECGELVQVIGKLLAYPDGIHPDDGPPLPERLETEIAHVLAAADFTIFANGLSADRIRTRHEYKLSLFDRWHQEGLRLA